MSYRPLLQVLEGHTYAVYGAAFLPGGKRALTSAGDPTVRRWGLCP